MSNFDPNSPSDNEWDERGDLAWNEFDWEQYLREQDDVLHRYLAFYEQLRNNPERVDEVAHLMRWDEDVWTMDAGATTEQPEETEEDIEAESPEFDTEPYTLHKSPVFIATKAIYLSVTRAWERMATDATKVPQPLAITLLSSLHRGEQQAVLAIQALDFGDFAMAISLFKRAMAELNRTFGMLDEHTATTSRALMNFRQDALPRLFDLREIWLRVIRECRQELQRPIDSDEDDE